MFLKNMTKPAIVFGGSGSGGGGGGGSSRAPVSSPRPKQRPNTRTVSGFQGPNIDGSAGYSTTFTTKSDGSLDRAVGANTSNGDSIYNAGRTINRQTSAVTAPTTSDNSPQSAPVTAPETTDPRDGVGGGRDGGGSARRKASKTQEDNVSVRRKSLGIENYKRERPARNAGNARRPVPSPMAITKNQ